LRQLPLHPVGGVASHLVRWGYSLAWIHKGEGQEGKAGVQDETDVG
jgi:hypothetical protein